jgi:hypothetical protein
MQELARKKRWWFARGAFAPSLVLFEDNPKWRKPTAVLGAPNSPPPLEFQVTTQYKAGYHVSSQIPCVEAKDGQRLVFIKYYGPAFGLRYVGAMYVNTIQEIAKGHEGISQLLQSRYKHSLPEKVDYFRLLDPEQVEPFDIPPPPEEGKDAAPGTVPEHGEIIVLQASDTPPEESFAVRYTLFPRFMAPIPVPRVLSFGEQMLADAEAGLLGVNVKFVAADDSFTITAHRSALCTVQYFRRLFTTGVKEGQAPPTPDKDGFYLILPPAFANEKTMLNFRKWVYTRSMDKDIKLDVPLCLSLSILESDRTDIVRLGNYCLIEPLVHDCVEIVGKVKSFDVATSLDALELAELIEASQAAILRRRAMQYVVAHFNEVAATEQFRKLVGGPVYNAIVGAVYRVDPPSARTNSTVECLLCRVSN